jgi:predicted alpha/beta-fold hydrolase
MCMILRHPRADLSWASMQVDRLQGELEIVLRHGLYGESLDELVERLAHAVEHRERTTRWLMLCACGVHAGLSKPPRPSDADAGPRLVLAEQTVLA